MISPCECKAELVFLGFADLHCRYEKIIMGKVNYPDTFSKPLEDIVSRFLVTNPSKRLGNMKGGLADVTKHKWFGSFDWHGLGAGTLSAPFVPDLTIFDSALAAAREKPPAGEEDDDLEVRKDTSLCLLITLTCV